MITLGGFQNDMITLEKRRKNRERQDQAARAEREREEPPAMTGAHAAAQGEIAEAARERAAVKSYEERGSVPGPSEGLQPGQIEPQDFRRGYLGQGHGARSPQAGPPRESPMPDVPRGVPVPLGELAEPRVSGAPGPAMQGLAQHRAAARYVMTSPSLRDGE